MSDKTGPQDHQHEETQVQELGIEELLERAMNLMATLQESQDPIATSALELVDYLEAWHREALTRLAMAMPPQAMDEVRADPVVAHLLDVYLGEDDVDDPDAVVAEALEEIRPYVHSHGGEMEVASIDVQAGVVTLSLLGSCDGCPSSALTLTQGVEGILRERWPGFTRLQVQGEETPVAPPQLLQIQSLRRS